MGFRVGFVLGFLTGRWIGTDDGLEVVVVVVVDSDCSLGKGALVAGGRRGPNVGFCTRARRSTVGCCYLIQTDESGFVSDWGGFGRDMTKKGSLKCIYETLGLSVTTCLESST